MVGMKRLTNKQVIARIRAACTKAGSNKAFAASIGISETYLQYILAEIRPPTKVVLEPLGLRWEKFVVEANS